MPRKRESMKGEGDIPGVSRHTLLRHWGMPLPGVAIARCYSRGWSLGDGGHPFRPGPPLGACHAGGGAPPGGGLPQPPRRGLFFDVSPRSYCAQAADWCACQGFCPAWAPVLPRPGGELGGATPGPVAVEGCPGGGEARGNLGPSPGLRLARGLVPSPVPGEAAQAVDIFFPPQ